MYLTLFLNRFIRENILSETITFATKPFYRDLENPDLLKKHVTGKIQNLNKLFNEVDKSINKRTRETSYTIYIYIYMILLLHLMMANLVDRKSWKS